MNPQARWTGVPEAVWDYRLGGYPVLKKWLSYRATGVLGRPPSLAEVREFSGIARRIAALLGLGERLDALYRGSMSLTGTMPFGDQAGFAELEPTTPKGGL